MSDGLGSELAKQVGKPLYQDAIGPGAVEVGKSLATIGKTVNVLLAPLRAMVWGSEALEAWLNTRVAEKLAARKAVEIKSPDPRVAVPALSHVRLCEEEPALQDMFASLLAASMDASSASRVHPSYVEVLRQCSTLDAQVLLLFCKRKHHPAIKPLIVNNSDPNVVRFPAPPGWRIDPGQFFAFPDLLKLAGEAIPASIDNLSRLGVLAVREGVVHVFDAEYIEVRNAETVREAVAVLRNQLAGHPDGKLVTLECAISLTSFGFGFVELLGPPEDPKGS